MAKSTKTRKSKAISHLERIQELMAQQPSPFEGMTEEEAIREIKKTRYRLWKEKFAPRS